MDPDRIVRDFSEAWGRADLEQIMDAFAEDAVYHNMPMEPLKGKPAIRAGIESFFKMSPKGIDFEILHQVTSGNVVMNERVDTFESEDGSKGSCSDGVGRAVRSHDCSIDDRNRHPSRFRRSFHRCDGSWSLSATHRVS